MSRWLWWLAAKITGPCERREVLEAVDLELHEDAAERQDPGRQARAPQRRAPASDRFHAGKSIGSADATGRGAPGFERPE